MTGTVTGQVFVFPGRHVCATGATFWGAVVVIGGALTLTDSSVAQGVTTHGATFVRICGSGINRVLSVIRGSGSVTIGDPNENCAGNDLTVVGLNVSQNRAGAVLARRVRMSY